MTKPPSIWDPENTGHLSVGNGACKFPCPQKVTHPMIRGLLQGKGALSSVGCDLAEPRSRTAGHPGKGLWPQAPGAMLGEAPQWLLPQDRMQNFEEKDRFVWKNLDLSAYACEIKTKQLPPPPAPLHGMRWMSENTQSISDTWEVPSQGLRESQIHHWSETLRALFNISRSK